MPVPWSSVLISQICNNPSGSCFYLKNKVCFTFWFIVLCPVHDLRLCSLYITARELPRGSSCSWNTGLAAWRTVTTGRESSLRSCMKPRCIHLRKFRDSFLENDRHARPPFFFQWTLRNQLYRCFQALVDVVFLFPAFPPKRNFSDFCRFSLTHDLHGCVPS